MHGVCEQDFIGGAQNRMNCLFVISLKKNQKNIFWNMMKHLDIPLR